METKNIDIFFNAHLRVSGIMFCKQCLAYSLHIDWCYHAIHKHSRWFQHISVLTTCSNMTILGMHRRPFEGRYLVNYASSLV